MADENFLSNKEIVMNLMDRMNELEDSLQETNRIITKYNGLREDLEESEIEVDEVKGELEELKDNVTNINNSKKVGNTIKEKLIRYGSWIFGFVMFILYLYEIGLLDNLIG